MLYQFYHEIIGSRIFGPTDPFLREFHSIYSRYSHVHQWIKASSQLAPTNIQWPGFRSQLCLPPRQKKVAAAQAVHRKGQQLAGGQAILGCSLWIFWSYSKQTNEYKWSDMIRLVVYLPLWKMMEFVSWDDDIPNIWKVIIQPCSKPPISDQIWSDASYFKLDMSNFSCLRSTTNQYFSVRHRASLVFEDIGSIDSSYQPKHQHV